MKKAIKFLLFVIALFVTVNVKALDEDITIEASHNVLDGISVKEVKGVSNGIAFCLDRAKGFPEYLSYKILTENVLTDIDKETNEKYTVDGSKIRNVIIKAYIDGLGTDSNVYGLTNDEFYAVTQMAVWHAAHGTRQQGMYNNIYSSWLSEKSARQKAYDTLIGVENVNQIISNNIEFNSSDLKMHLSSDEKQFISDKISIKGSGNVSYTVNASEGTCVSYNGKCESSATVKSGEEFYLVTDNNSNSVSVSATVTSSLYLTGYEFSMYRPNDIDATVNDGIQRTAVFVPYYDSIKKQVTVEGKKETKTTEKKNLKVSKTDATGQSELDGAKINVYELGNSEPYDSWTSKKDVKHEIEGLVVGKIYRMEEVSSPVGFDKLTVNIYFKLLEDGTTQLCNVKNDDEKTAECGGTKFVDENGVTYAEINGEVLVIKNYPSKTEVKTGKVKISKKDFTNGEEIPGAHLQILDENGNIKADWISTTEPYEIELPVGKYTLIETIPATDYDSEMIIDGDRTSRYEFEITEDGMSKIDVYNQLKGKIIDTPITGMSVTSLYIIGSLVTLAGASVVVYAKKKENM